MQVRPELRVPPVRTGAGQVRHLTEQRGGIEDEHVLELLQEYGCAVAQGFYLSRPVPAGEIPGLVAGRDRPAVTPSQRFSRLVPPDLLESSRQHIGKRQAPFGLATSFELAR